MEAVVLVIWLAQQTRDGRMAFPGAHIARGILNCCWHSATS